MSLSTPTTLQELLYQLGRADEREAELQDELRRHRDRVADLRRLAATYLDRLDEGDEAFEAYGRAYWLDERGLICSFALRQTYDVVLDGPTEADVVAVREDSGRIVAILPADVPDADLAELAEAQDFGSPSR